MNLTTFAQLSRRGRRLVWGGALTGLLLAVGATAIGDISPDAKRRLADARRESFSLFAGPTAVLRGNQLQCGLTNDGNGTCTNIFNSPTGGGGFWPTGSPNQYIFNTGMQVAGIMGADGGPWASDTVGAFFFDASGTNPSGTAVSDIFDSLNLDDLANWPAAAVVSDADLFDDVLLGRLAASQQDSWMQYWDGDPSKISGRQHPMGILVTSRSMGWNFPAGNESVIYFIFEIKNVTAGAGSDFQRLNEAHFFAGNNELPDSGITFNEVYAAFATDMDVGSTATDNYSTAILPFDMGISYQGGFNLPEFTYSPELFFPPFFTDAPGIIGVKYLKSPINPITGQQVGLTLFSATLRTGVGTLPDPGTDKQLWRYLSGKLNAAQGDVPCSITAEITEPSLAQRSLCFLTESAEDTRFFQSSGPFTLAPDSIAKVVVAYIAAPTVETMPDGTPSGISANDVPTANPPGIPSFHPEFPSSRGCTNASATSCTENDPVNALKDIERGAGWFEYKPGTPTPATALEGPQGKVSQFDVAVVPGSLLGRALVAQTIFDTKFLLGFAPDPPIFGLVPGDGKVTVIWEKSLTEDPSVLPDAGDPFFKSAGDPASALFNPNYRQFDVEGYRIWRGTSSGSLTLVRQFDYSSTVFLDNTCETVLPGQDVADFSASGTTNPNGDGFVLGDPCPVDFQKANPINSGLVFNNGADGSGPGGGIVRLASGAAFATKLTTAIVDDPGGEKTPLADTGVPFSFTDNSVTNNFTYFYAVSAFDVNSQASGPHTLRSARISQSTIPRANAPELFIDADFTISLVDGEGQPLDTSIPLPTLDPNDGTWSGPFPPSVGESVPDLSLVPMDALLLSEGSVTVRVDSAMLVPETNSPTDELGTCSNPEGVGSNSNPFGACWRMFLTVTDPTGATTEILAGGYNPWWSAFGEAGVITFPLFKAEFPFDSETLDAFGVGSGFALAGATVSTSESIMFSSSEGPQNRRGFSNFHNGARWYDGDGGAGANEVTPDPAVYRSVGVVSGATVMAPVSHTPANAADEANTALPWNDNEVMMARQCFARVASAMEHFTDLVFSWSGGTVSVRDVVYNSDLPFSDRIGTTWGFLVDDPNGNGVLDWHDFNYIDGAVQIMPALGSSGGGNCNSFDDTSFGADEVAKLVNLVPDLSGGLVPTSTDIDSDVDFENGGIVAQTGTGFGLYVMGHRFIFETTSVPADGTTWTLRTFGGTINVETSSDDPDGYAYLSSETGNAGLTPILIPGLGFKYTVSDRIVELSTPNLSAIHTVPDPYLGTSLYDLAPTTKQLMFVNLPAVATIRIYSLTGVLVDVIVHDSPTAGGRAQWNVRNRNRQFVASGVYFYHVVTPDGQEIVKKFTIINQAGSN